MKKQTFIFSIIFPTLVLMICCFAFGNNFSVIANFLILFLTGLGFLYILPVMLISLTRKGKFYQSQAWVPGIFLNSIYAVLFCLISSNQLDVLEDSQGDLASGLAIIATDLFIFIIGFVFFTLNIIFALMLEEKDS